jgi:hypothetical protein
MHNKQAGIAGIFVMFLVLLFIIAGIIGLDFGYIGYITRCGDTPLGECLKATPTPTPNPETSVVAVGTFSAKGYGVTITMNVPLEGGPVSGSFSGDCQGNISGSYDGNDNGIISGEAYGSCNPFKVPLPASATFAGNANKTSKTIDISGQGTAVGVSGNGSLTLTF